MAHESEPGTSVDPLTEIVAVTAGSALALRAVCAVLLARVATLCPDPEGELTKLSRGMREMSKNLALSIARDHQTDLVVRDLVTTIDQVSEIAGSLMPKSVAVLAKSVPFKNAQWEVTEEGMTSIRSGAPIVYEIEASRLLEGSLYYDWPPHMAEKTWVDYELFEEAFEVALQVHAGKQSEVLDRELLRKSLDLGRRTARETAKS